MVGDGGGGDEEGGVFGDAEEAVVEDGGHFRRVESHRGVSANFEIESGGGGGGGALIAARAVVYPGVRHRSALTHDAYISWSSTSSTSWVRD